MNVLVFGATGKTGSLVVDRALAQGHTVTVLVRNAAKFSRPNVRVLTGDATHPTDVLSAMHGQQAVIEAIGGTTSYKATQLETTSIRNIIAAMRSEGVPRLIVVTMMGLGDSRSQSPFWYKHLLMRTFLRGSTQDKIHTEAAVVSSGLDYVIARPPILKDGPATGRISILGPTAIGHAITRADLASFLVDQLTSNANLGRAVTIVNT